MLAGVLALYVEGNEVADVEAKKAAKGLESGRVHPHPILDKRGGIPRSAAAIKAEAKTRMAEEWGRDWKESPQCIQTTKFDAHPPSARIGKFYSGFNRRETSLVVQLRSNHIPLANYLHRIKAIDSRNCLRCNEPETVEHYLLRCRRYQDERNRLREEIGRRPFNLTTLLGTPNMIPHTIQFVHNTKRFPIMSSKSSPSPDKSRISTHHDRSP